MWPACSQRIILGISLLCDHSVLTLLSIKWPLFPLQVAKQRRATSFHALDSSFLLGLRKTREILGWQARPRVEVWLNLSPGLFVSRQMAGQSRNTLLSVWSEVQGQTEKKTNSAIEELSSVCPGTPDLPLETLSSHSFYKFFVVFCFLLSRDFPKLLSFFCRPRDSGVLARETAGRSGGVL